MQQLLYSILVEIFTYIRQNLTMEGYMAFWETITAFHQTTYHKLNVVLLQHCNNILIATSKFL